MWIFTRFSSFSIHKNLPERGGLRIAYEIFAWEMKNNQLTSNENLYFNWRNNSELDSADRLMKIFIKVYQDFHELVKKLRSEH